LEHWNPLTHPASGLETISKWRALLQSFASIDETNPLLPSRTGDVYEQLISTVILPRVRFVVTNMWSPKDYAPLIRFMETWDRFLPRNIQETISTSLVLPKLQQEVDLWNPRADVIPIHSWIHPWLPYIGIHIVLYA